MKKIVEVSFLETVPDWNTTDLPSGLYWHPPTLAFIMYEGNHMLPCTYYCSLEFIVFKDMPEEKIPNSPTTVNSLQSIVSYNDLIKLVAVIRTSPENLRIEEIE
jgi:hypothetical protein